MNGKFKALTMAVVAMFCLTAVVCVVSDADTSADDNKVHYFYIEIVNEDGMVTSTDWIKFTSTAELENYVEEANKAFKFYGYPELQFVNGKYLSLKYNGTAKNSCFVGSEDGKEWVKVEDTKLQYPPATYAGIALGNGFISKEVYDALGENQKFWAKSDMGEGYPDYAYVKTILEAKTTDVPKEFPAEFTSHIFVEVIGADGKDVSSKWIEFQTLKTLKSFVANANEALANEGFVDVVCLSSGWLKTGINATFYAKDGKWVAVEKTETDYLNDTIALATGNGYIGPDVYNALSDAEKKTWKDTGYPGAYQYIKEISESTTGYKSDDGNTGLIVGVVVAVVALLAIGVFFFLRKK